MDLRPISGIVDEAVVGRDPVRVVPAVHVDAQELAEQRARILAAAERVAAAAAIAHADEEVPLGIERDRAAVVVREGLRDAQEDPLPGRVRARVGDGELAHDRRGVLGRRVVHEESRIVREVRVEGEPEQPLLPAGPDLRGDVEVGLRSDRARRVDDPDRPLLLDDVELGRAVPGGRDVDRLRETFGEWLQADGDVAGVGAEHLAAARDGDEDDRDEHREHRDQDEARAASEARLTGRRAPPRHGRRGSRTEQLRIGHRVAREAIDDPWRHVGHPAQLRDHRRHHERPEVVVGQHAQARGRLPRCSPRSGPGGRRHATSARRLRNRRTACRSRSPVRASGMPDTVAASAADMPR